MYADQNCSDGGPDSRNSDVELLVLERVFFKNMIAILDHFSNLSTISSLMNLQKSASKSDFSLYYS